MFRFHINSGRALSSHYQSASFVLPARGFAGLGALGDDTGLDALPIDNSMSSLDSISPINLPDTTSLSLAPTDLNNSSLPFGIPNFANTNVSSLYGDVGPTGALTVPGANGTPLQVGQFDAAGNFSQTPAQSGLNFNNLASAINQITNSIAPVAGALTNNSGTPIAAAGANPAPGTTTIAGHTFSNTTLGIGAAVVAAILLFSGGRASAGKRKR